MASQFNLALIPERAQKYFEANPNVLVIEDDKILGQMVSEILDDVGFNVKTAINGKLALNILNEEPVDFVVLDILLPEMDGFEVGTKIRQDPETKDLPIMIVSAWADDNNRKRAEEDLDIHHFLAKPFTEDELLFGILTLLVDSSRKGSE